MRKRLASIVLRVFILCLLVFGVGLVRSVPCEASWARTYGGPLTEYTGSLARTSDGGYVMAGMTASTGAGETDCLVLKFDSDLNLEWQKTYGASGYEACWSIQQTEPDRGYIALGNTRSFGSGAQAVWLLKLDNSGNVEWQKAYGGAIGEDGVTVRQTSSGYIVGARTNSFGKGNNDFWLLNLDASGNILWQNSYGGPSTEFLYDLELATGGGYILVGQTMSYGAGGNDALVVKVEADGNIAWQKTYGGTLGDWANSVQVVDGGYVIHAETASFGAGQRDVWILKIDENGEIIWQKTYGGPASDEGDGFGRIRQTSDQGYIVTAATMSFGAGDYDAWLLKLDAGGNVQWQRSYGGAGWEWAYLAEEMADGGYIMAADTRSFGVGVSDMWLLKLEADGSLANCPFSEVTNATVTDTVVTGVTSTAEMTTTTATPVDTSVVPADSTMVPLSVCGVPSGPERLKIGATRKKHGDGTITSLDGLIDCPDVCETLYNTDISTILTATPAPLSTFLGWKPTPLGCETTNPVCQVTMDKKISVKAIFQGPNKLKVVTTFKNGATGTVTSGDTFINCPGDCEESYILSAPVTLTATAGPSSAFVKWTGNPCKDEPTNVCAFTIDKNAAVKAIFETTP